MFLNSVLGFRLEVPPDLSFCMHHTAAPLKAGVAHQPFRLHSPNALICHVSQIQSEFCSPRMDDVLKLEGIFNIGAILKNSKSMLVLWDRAFEDLWHPLR